MVGKKLFERAVEHDWAVEARSGSAMGVSTRNEVTVANDEKLTPVRAVRNRGRRQVRRISDSGQRRRGRVEAVVVASVLCGSACGGGRGVVSGNQDGGRAGQVGGAGGDFGGGGDGSGHGGQPSGGAASEAGATGADDCSAAVGGFEWSLWQDPDALAEWLFRCSSERVGARLEAGRSASAGMGFVPSNSSTAADLSGLYRVRFEADVTLDQVFRFELTHAKRDRGCFWSLRGTGAPHTYVLDAGTDAPGLEQLDGCWAHSGIPLQLSQVSNASFVAAWDNDSSFTIVVTSMEFLFL